MVDVNVNPGICGLKSVIRVNSEDMQTATIEIETECPYIKKLEQEIKEVDGFEECFSKLGESKIYKAAGSNCKHAACPVPSAIMKGVEVACGLVLPKDINITISKE